MKLCRMVAVYDVITYTNFGDDCLRGLGTAEGQIVPLIVVFTIISHYCALVQMCDLLL